MGNHLNIPEKTKISEFGEIENLSYGFSCMQGWRNSMEDSHLILPYFTQEYSLFGIFDGHGGREVAVFCSIFFPKELLKNSNFQKGNYKQALIETFLKMDEILFTKKGKTYLSDFADRPIKEVNSGCTALVLLISKKDYYLANAGDCRALLSGDGVTQLTVDHSPNNLQEAQRIEQAGGFIHNGRVNKNLNLTRAIGDLSYKKNRSLPPQNQIITSNPDIFYREISEKDEILIMGCDGVFETKSNLQICQQVNKRLKQNPIVNLSVVAEDLLDYVIAMDCSQGMGCDNMSCLILKFKKNQIKKSGIF